MVLWLCINFEVIRIDVDGVKCQSNWLWIMKFQFHRKSVYNLNGFNRRRQQQSTHTCTNIMKFNYYFSVIVSNWFKCLFFFIQNWIRIWSWDRWLPQHKLVLLTAAAAITAADAVVCWRCSLCMRVLICPIKQYIDFIYHIFYAIAFIKVFLSIALAMFRPKRKTKRKKNSNEHKKAPTYFEKHKCKLKKSHKIKINMTVVDCTHYPYQVITSISFLFFHVVCTFFSSSSFICHGFWFFLVGVFSWWLRRRRRCCCGWNKYNHSHSHAS